jgi:hypothetical protein
LLQWITDYFDFIRGKSQKVNTPSLANGFNTEDANRFEVVPSPEYRKTVIISHLDRAGRPVKVYTLYNAFPIEYKPASDFSADTDDTLSMEKLVLTYESFDVESITPDINPLNPSDVLKRLIRRT